MLLLNDLVFLNPSHEEYFNQSYYGDWELVEDGDLKQSLTDFVKDANDYMEAHFGITVYDAFGLNDEQIARSSKGETPQMLIDRMAHKYNLTHKNQF